MDELLEGVIGVMYGVLGGISLIGSVYAPLILRRRHIAPRRLAEAEGKIESKTDLRNAYETLENLHHAGGLPISVPKKIRDRAEYLVEMMESEYQTVIEREIRENMPNSDPQFNMGLSHRRISVSPQERVFDLRDLSPTYRKYFLGPAEKK